MAEEEKTLESYLTCFLCSEMYKDPVSLRCRHTFCSSCLQRLWRYNKSAKQCPICRTKLRRDAGVNVALKEFTDSFAGRLRPDPPKDLDLVCSEHKEEAKLFCKNEQRPVCSVCDFPHDQCHNLVPIGQAVNEMKDKLKSDIKCLQDKRMKYKNAKETYNEMIQHSKKQLFYIEKQIRFQFNKLQQFLKEEEESRLAALKGEEEQKGNTMVRENMDDKLSSLSDSIYVAEEELLKHNASFLSSYKATQSRTQSQCSMSDPQLPSAALIDVAKHLGNLSFRVWDKMRKKMKSITSTPVILDPNTANRWLYLSDDLTSVRHGSTQQQLPDNPERNSNFDLVLGSEGFSSGTHSWDVEVGDLPEWTVGLAKESADRKSERCISPKAGFWCLLHSTGKYTDGLGGTVNVKSLHRIRVQLDYDSGDVSFYNLEDMTLIYTYTDSFTEKLFPCFGVGSAIDAKSKELKICPSEISL